MGEDFRLKWNDHHSVFFSTAESLCHGDHLTDVTLSCGNREFSAHKLVLSICSSYFSQLFAPRPNAKRRPADAAAIVYLKDVDARHMELLLNYMYRGEINVEEAELMGLLATAKGLQIKGLTEGDEPETPKEERSTPVRSIPRGSSSSSGVKRPATQTASSSKNTNVPAPKKIKEETVAVDPPQAVDEDENDHYNAAQNPEYLDDTEELADYTMEDNPGESMVYEGDPNNPGVYEGEYFEDVSDRKSQVWLHFLLCRSTDKGRCKHCGKIINFYGKSTSNLRGHLRNKHGLNL